MRRLGDLIEKNVPDLAALETDDTGLPIHQTSKQLIPRAADNFYFFSEVATRMDGQSLSVDRTMLNYTLLQPVGVCGADLAVERAVHDGDVEGRAVPRAGQHGGAEDVGAVADDRRPPWAARARGRHARRGAQRRARLRREAGEALVAPSRRARDLVHRRNRHRPADHGARPA